MLRPLPRASAALFTTRAGGRAAAPLPRPRAFGGPPPPLRATPRFGGPLRAGAPSPVISPAGAGRRLPFYSWGYPGQIDDLARMPSLARKALPWLRIDERRIYAIGDSMGGQEALLLAARGDVR